MMERPLTTNKYGNRVISQLYSSFEPQWELFLSWVKDGFPVEIFFTQKKKRKENSLITLYLTYES